MSKNQKKTSKKPPTPQKEATNPIQKQEKVDQNKKNKEEVSIPELFVEDFEKQSKRLSLFYSRFLSLRNLWELPSHPDFLFLKWLDYYYERTEEELYRGLSFSQIIQNPDNIYKAAKEKIFFQNFNYFKKGDAKWPLRFDSNFFFFSLFIS